MVLLDFQRLDVSPHRIDGSRIASFLILIVLASQV